MTTQEESLKQFFRQINVEFESQKRFLGYGDKQWRVDFYLPSKGIIIECKSISGKKDAKLIFTDMYKLDELGEKYELTKVLFLQQPHIYNLRTFIDNATAHEIFIINNPIQLFPIFQGISHKKQNDAIKPQEKLSKPVISTIPYDNTILAYLKYHSTRRAAKTLGVSHTTVAQRIKDFIESQKEGKEK